MLEKSSVGKLAFCKVLPALILHRISLLRSPGKPIVCLVGIGRLVRLRRAVHEYNENAKNAGINRHTVGRPLLCGLP